jgi:pimeloyl-ACP methyl ester carboxylesterase
VVILPAVVSVSTGDFVFDGHRLVYYEYGSGSRPLLLLPGLLLPQTMHGPLAQSLAERGNRVITLDFLGHGQSDRPRDMWRYSMPGFGQQAVALLDHLEIEEAVVGGTSLGANATLEAAVHAPDRMRGLVVEMPVLDNALLGCALAFTPLLVSLTFGAPITRVISRVAARVPRGLTHLTDVGLDWISQDPGPSAAVLQGLFFGRTAPPRSERSRIETRSLVIGHGRDPVHPFSDSDALVRELRNGRLIEANSILELRLAPARLTGEIARFLDECWRRPARSASDPAEREASSA